MICPSKIRPMRGISETEVSCEEPPGHGVTHAGLLRNYAFPGSSSAIYWDDLDRRSFTGEFVECDQDCKLPAEHRGGHVSPSAP